MKSTSPAARGRPRRTAGDIAETQSVIASAARDLFASEGYSAVSIRRVAVAAGMTPMTFYAYFDSKVDLLRHLWLDILTGLFDALEILAGSEGDAEQRLRTVSCAYVRYWVDHPDHYRMVFMSEGISQPDVSVFAANDAVGERFALFHRCITAVGDAQPGTATMRSQLLICSLQGIAHCHVTISGYAWPEPERLVESLVGALCPATKPS